MGSLLGKVARWNEKLNKYAEEQSYLYREYGLFQFISNPIFYLIWIFSDHNGYENLTLRIVLSLLSIPLIFFNHWGDKYKKVLSLYWYLTMLYSIMFFFSYMLMKNSFSQTWILNSMSGVVLGVLLLDMPTFFYYYSQGLV